MRELLHKVYPILVVYQTYLNLKYRNDQSIITNLVIKYGIKTFEFGDKDVNIFIDLLKTPAIIRKPKHLIYKLRNRLSKQ